MSAMSFVEAQTGQHSAIDTLVVVGVGLIGGSVAAALRSQHGVRRIIGVGRNANSLQKALDLQLIDEVMPAAEAAAVADVVLLATPVGATEAVLRDMYPHLSPKAVLTDAGSTKVDVVGAARRALKDKIHQFVPGHPIAGAERAGPEAAHEALYRDRTVILTPLEEGCEKAQQQVTQLWQTCGARVIVMDAPTHDKVLASVSHVPHFLSAVYMWQVASADDADLRLAVAGSGFRDYTRIAAGSPEVWRDIFLSNREAVLSELREVRQAFEQAEEALQSADAEKLERFLERAALARRLWGSRSGL